MNRELLSILEQLRKERLFNAHGYLESKSLALSRYFKEFNINACVVGISGGVDSAVTLGILKHVQSKPDSILNKIVPALLPINYSSGATNQEQASSRGKEVVSHFNLTPFEFELSEAFLKFKEKIDSSLKISGNPWAEGQLVSYIRTPALYYITSLLSQEGFNACVCGTTNRDEGSYVGFFGKASDGMVDIQIISDIHKSEVYQLGNLLKLPSSVLTAAPSGDTFDGKKDEEMMGVSYDFLELFQSLKCLEKSQKEALLLKLSAEAKKEFELGESIIEDLHSKNLHKYMGQSNSIHFDIYPRSVPGGAISFQKPARPIESLDPYYRGMYETLKDPISLYEAAYIVEKPGEYLQSDITSSPNFFVTPVNKIQKRYEEFKKNNIDSDFAVLVTAGGFCPPHEGHILMMDSAKEAVEAEGINVLGGYLSPSHDVYVQTKPSVGNITSTERNKLCEEIVSNSDWLMVDPWESKYINYAVNFTTVIERLSNYLSTHILTNKPITVYFVFGSDNARFSLAFLKQGKGVCILRPGFENEFEKYKNSPNVIFVKGNKSFPVSSHKIRAENGIKNLENSTKKKGRKIRLRYEGLWALSPWENITGREKLVASYQTFFSSVQVALGSVFKSIPLEIETDISLLENQNIKSSTPVISLDPCREGEVNLGISRCFSLAAHEDAPLMVNRPGTPSLEAQLLSVPSGSYVLRDDDSYSGITLDFVRQTLPSHCYLQGLDISGMKKEDDNWSNEIADVRDFLIGSKEGGLVVLLPNGNVARAPYIAPYVHVHDRASVPLDQELPFSLKIWKLNYEFFNSLNIDIPLSAASKGFQTLMSYLGFKENTSLSDICLWHIHRLET